MGFIYKIENNLNNKLYIGMTTMTLKERWRRHKTAYKTNDSPLYHDMRKYGFKQFCIKAIEEVENNEDMPDRERYWIKELNTLTPHGYNRTIGGYSLKGVHNPFYGRKHTNETRYKLSKIASKRTGDLNHFYGKSHSQYTKDLISKRNSGKVRSEKTKEYLSKINTGERNPFYSKTHTKETRKILSIKRQTKSILMKNRDGTVIRYFELIEDAVKYIRQNGLCKETTSDKSIRSAIGKAINHNTSSYGYYWKVKQGSANQ